MSARISSSVSAFARHQTTYSLAVILACAAVWTSSTALTATAIPRIALTVRVYQIASLPSALEQRALAEADTVLRAGLVDVRWQECTGLNSSPACAVPLGPSELLLVVRKGALCQDTSPTLGEALVGRGRRARDVLAIAYFSCIESLATSARTDVAVLLGRVVAHELGHLIMHTSTHARRGLMRPNWTPEELQLNRSADWTFTAGDVVAMREPQPEH